MGVGYLFRRGISTLDKGRVLYPLPLDIAVIPYPQLVLTLVAIESLMVGKRVVCILLKCFLVGCVTIFVGFITAE